MNIQSTSYSDRSYHYFATIRPYGIEHRYCYSKWTIGHFGFATWLEQQGNGLTRVTQTPEFFLTKTAAKARAFERHDEARRTCPPCTYHQVIVTKAEFANSMIKEQYQTLRRCVLAQRIAKADFAITFHRHYYRLSFREMNSTIQNAILFLKMNGVIGNQGYSDLTIEYEGRLEDLRGYKA